MAIKLTPESFLNVVKQSNLVTGDVLKRTLAELRDAGVSLETSREIADELVERNLLTRWQADKLLQGKHKGFFLGKYRLLKLLGKGGMSSVYLAEHVLMRRQCAIKVLPTKRVNDTSYLGRFHREAQAVASLDHPNIIKAYDVDKEMEKDTEIHFLVMEFVDGRSLQEMIAQDGPLDFQTAADFIRQSAAGLAHAHHAGMVHRDIKPGNLLIDRNGVIKLLDMGLARFFNDGEEESLTVAHDEKVLGTADYLAPEQALDSHSVDARADIYSLGCTFYFLLTGHPPFTEGTLAQRLMSHQTKVPPAVTVDRPDTPPDLLPILQKMMAKKREDRYQTADDVVADLTAWLGEHGTEEWQEAHPGLSGNGRKRGDSSQKLSAGKTETQAEAQPAVPVAKPVAPAPLAAEPVEDAGSELSAFLANLGSADSGAGTSNVQEPPAPAKPAQAKPVSAKPAHAKPVHSAPIAKPVHSAKPPTAAPVAGNSSNTAQAAKPAVPVASAVPNSSAQTAVAEEPDFPFPDNEFVIDTSPSSSLPTFVSSQSPRTAAKKPSPETLKNLLQNKRLLAGAGGGLLVVLLGLGGFWLFGGGDANGGGSNQTDPQNQDKDQAGNPQGPNLIGKPILVGKNGAFPSLAKALAYVKKHYDPLEEETPQEIRLAAGEVFAERIDLANRYMAKLPFPEGVRITTDAGNPAVLKPGGADPVIRLADGIRDLQINNLIIDAGGKNTAIKLQGELAKTQLRNLSLKGYKKIGLRAESAFGSPRFGDEQRPVVIAGRDVSRFRTGNHRPFDGEHRVDPQRESSRRNPRPELPISRPDENRLGNQ